MTCEPVVTRFHFLEVLFEEKKIFSQIKTLYHNIYGNNISYVNLL
jgi:hypothetical protein